MLYLLSYSLILTEKPNSVQSLTLVGVAAELILASFSLNIFCVAGILVCFSPSGIPCSDAKVYIYETPLA